MAFTQGRGTPEQSTHGLAVDLSTTTAPSETAPSTKVHEAPQQASTSPGDGAEVQDHTPEVADPHQTSFKDQVIGYAKITRGKALDKPETQEEGQRILAGDASLHKYPVAGEKE